MPFPNNERSNTKDLVLMSLFISVALVLSYIERLIPMSYAVPGVKLGLANVVTCVALYHFKPRASLTIVVVRVILVGIFIGSATSFLYSLTGGLLSFLGMLTVMKILKDHVSPVGVSVVGAFLHNIGQVIVLSIITASLSVGMAYLPILIITGIFTGILVGATALLSIRYLKHFKLI